MTNPKFYDSNTGNHFTPAESGWYIQYNTESGDWGAIKVEREPLNDYEALTMLQIINPDELWKVKFFAEVKHKNKLPKLLIIGHARHGKDSFAEILRDEFGLTFISSSQAAADIFIYDELKDKYGYKTSVECFEDRVNHRPEWYEMICDYNKDDKARLAKGILELADCYVGMRDRGEILECMKQGLFDLIVWIDASERLPLESADSFNIDKNCADIIIENNTDIESFKTKVMRLGKIFNK